MNHVDAIYGFTIYLFVFAEVVNHQDLLSLTIRMVDEQQHVDDNELLEGVLGRNAVADIIEDALESFRDVVINGNESVPPLDPLVVESAGPVDMEMTG